MREHVGSSYVLVSTQGGADHLDSLKYNLMPSISVPGSILGKVPLACDSVIGQVTRVYFRPKV